MAQDHAAAWTAHDAPATALLFAEDCELTVNVTTTHRGRAELIESARALMDSFPDVRVICHMTRHAGHRAVFLWTLEGHHAETGHFVSLPGWHEWDLNEALQVQTCRGFFDAQDLQRKIDGN